MAGVVSNSTLDRLGRALRDGTMTPEDWELLRDLRTQWEDVMQQLRQLLVLELEGWAVEISARSKNAGTLREKLQRLSGGLSTVRDLVGCRVVVEGGRAEQTKIVDHLVGVLEAWRPKVISRIADPRAGYRAVHIEVRGDGVRVEIQVRTRAQHEWAEAMERFGDIAGRDIRYVDDASFTHRPPEIAQLLRECAGALAHWSEVLDTWESVDSPTTGELRERVVAAQQDFISRKAELDASL